MTFLALCFFLYFAPALIASSRGNVSSAAIWFVNLLCGWTVVGWVLCLIWALGGRREVMLYPAVGYGIAASSLGHPPGWTASGSQERICAACNRPMGYTARYCSMCGGNTSLVG